MGGLAAGAERDARRWLPPAVLGLGGFVSLDSGDVVRLGPLVARMHQAHPDREETSYYAAMLSFLTGNFPEANLGLLEMESGNRDAAVAYFAESLTLDPHQEVACAYLPAALAGTNP